MFPNTFPQLKIIQDIAKRQKVAVYLVGGFLRDYLFKKELALLRGQADPNFITNQRGEYAFI